MSSPSSPVSLTLRSLHAANNTAIEYYTLQQAEHELGSIRVKHSLDQAEWSLPAWQTIPTLAQWQSLIAALPGYYPAARHQFWLPVQLLAALHSNAQPISLPYHWLQAASRSVPEPHRIMVRYPTTADAVALAHLMQSVGATTLIGKQPDLGATIDVTLAGLNGAWGKVLEACSWVAEEGRFISGAVIATATNAVPLIPLCVATTARIAEELLLSVLDSLYDFRYSHAHLLMQASDPLLSTAEQVGFTLIETLVQVEQAELRG